jgi:predicted nucleotidyltransferase
VTGFGQILDDLNGAGVRYVLIGGIALIRHGVVRAETRRVDGVEAPICSLADLVALKRSAGRERDLVDLADLEAAHGDLPDSRDSSA